MTNYGEIRTTIGSVNITSKQTCKLAIKYLKYMMSDVIVEEE